MSGVAVEHGRRTAHDDTELAWVARTPPAARAVVLLLHGFGEHLGRYDHVAAVLTAAGLATLGEDARGHGASAGRRGHVRRFADYLDDLDGLVALGRARAGDRPLLAIAHSHGGLVLARRLVDRPELVDGAVLSAPYLALGMPTPPLRLAVARLASRIAAAAPLPTGITPDLLTSDPELQAAAAADPLSHQVATPRWFTEARRAQRETLAGAGKVTTPLLVLLPGHDRIADGTATRRFVAAVASTDVTVREYPGFEHEAFNEVERARPIADAVAWLVARAGAAGR